MTDWAELARNAILLGIARQDFWALCPIELKDRADYESHKRDRELKDLRTHAWLTACLGRVKEFPSLKSVLGSKSRQVPEDEMAQMRADHEQAQREVDALNKRLEAERLAKAKAQESETENG